MVIVSDNAQSIRFPSCLPVPEALPPRLMRKGSVFSLEEGCADSTTPQVSSSLTTWRKLKRKVEGKEVKTKRSDQNGCSLLSKLPYEIRLMIYQEVLGGHTLHIVMTAESKERETKEEKYQVVVESCYLFRLRLLLLLSRSDVYQ